MTYAASRSLINYDAGYVCHFVDAVIGKDARGELSNVYLNRYKNDILVHFHLLGFVKTLDWDRLWRECTADANGSWGGRPLEHRNFPDWAVKQKIPFLQLCTICEIASQLKMYSEVATIDLFLLAASGISGKASTRVPAWYSQIQSYDFVQFFEGQVEADIYAFEGRSLAQMCDSPLVQGDARRLLSRFQIAHKEVDIFEASAPAENCPMFSIMQQLKPAQKEAFSNTVRGLIDCVTPLDLYSAQLRKAPRYDPRNDQSQVQELSLDPP